MLDRKIEYFLKVVEQGSFSAAARELYLTQPALSKQIALLEQELDIKLFDRSGYRPVLTQQGQQYHHLVMLTYDGYLTGVKQIQKQHAKKLRIGFTSSWENREFLHHFRRVQKNFPNLDVSFAKCSFNDCAERILSGELDLCVTSEETVRGNDRIASLLLKEYKMCLICSYDSPLAALDSIDIQELRNYPMIGLSKEFSRHIYREFKEASRLDGVEPKISRVVDTFDELVYEVAAGAGVSITAAEMVQNQEVKIVLLKNSHHRSRSVLAYRSQENDPDILRIAREVQDSFREIDDGSTKERIMHAGSE